MLKVLFYGTHLKHYYLAKWLRARGHECTLVLDAKKPKNLPEASEISLESQYPDWIIECYGNPMNPLRRFMRLLGRSSLAPSFLQPILNKYEIFPSKKVQKLAAKHDVVFTSGPDNVVKSLHFSVPVVFRSLGSDMTKLPFQSENLQKAYIAYYFRRHIQRLSTIISYQEDIEWAAHFLAVGNKIKHYSIPTDIFQMRDSACGQTYDHLYKIYGNYDQVFFFPSRKNLDPLQPDYKGIDKALEALSRVVKQGLSNFRCIATDHGTHIENFKTMVKDWGLEDKFEFIQPQTITVLSSYMLQENFIVINDVGFTKSHLTGIGRECVSLGCILIDSVNPRKEQFSRLYGNERPPIYSAVGVEDIQSHIWEIVNLSRTERRLIKEKMRNWAFHNLHWEYRISELCEILYSAVDSQRLISNIPALSSTETKS